MMAYLRVTVVCATGLLLTLHGAAVDALAAPPDDELAADAVRIPLDRIWANWMPGTRDIGELDPDPRGLLVYEIRRSIAFPPPKGEEPKAGFAVLGTGLEALREAHAVLVKDKKRRNRFPEAREISLVFFSYQFGRYVQLLDVVRQGNVVDIRFQFVPHESMEATEHPAIIPLGMLPKGKYCVKIVRSPMAKKYVDLGFQAVSDEDARRVVCRSFSFSVGDDQGK